MRTPLLWLTAAAAVSASTFQGPIPIGLSNQGLTPVRIAGADMNRDGVGDLISLNAGAQAGTATLSIATGTRIGIASTVTEQPVIGLVLDMAVADFTGDTSPDILVLLQSTTFGSTRMNLCLFGGNGLGGLQVPNCTPVNDNATRLAAGDFNGDGRMDAVLSLPTNSQVAVWFNRGDQFFNAGPAAIVPTPGPMITTELNGDRIADLVVHNRAGELRVLASGQGVALRVDQVIPVSPSITDLTAGDVNRDGIADVVAADPAGNSYAVLLAAGGAAPFLQNPAVVPALAAPTFVQLVDFNGDRQPELLASTTAGITVAQFSSTGVLIPPPLPGFGIPSSIRTAVVDFNGDGQLDFASASGPNVTLFIGQPASTRLQFDATPLSSVFGQRTTVTARLFSNTFIPPIFPIGAPRFRLLRGDQLVQEVAATVSGTGQSELATARIDALLPVGTHDLTLVFPGTPGFAPATSTTIRVTVQPSPSTVRFSVAGNEISRANGLRVNALVSSPFGPAVDGNAQLLLNGAIIAQGLVTGGVAQMFIPPGLPLGRVRARLQFQGDGYVASASEEIDLVVRGPLTVVSAPNFRAPVAPGSLAVLSVPGLTIPAAQASAVPWPLILGRVSAEFRSEQGATAAGIVFAGDGQVNVYVPPETPTGTRMVRLFLDGADIASGDVTVARVAPGIFMIDGRVDGIPAALAAVYSTSGTVTDIPVFRCESSVCVAAPMAVPANTDVLVLSLFATGVRNAARVTATVGGLTAEVLFAGAHPATPGLDQINIVIPRAAAGRGVTDVIVTADGAVSNRAQVNVQ
ncbi:MAG: hypothetical protein FJW30_14600 [Acidobacteria bacterium]|nr:hypothetical protein [Acidobacteriota bacterium]